MVVCLRNMVSLICFDQMRCRFSEWDDEVSLDHALILSLRICACECCILILALYSEWGNLYAYFQDVFRLASF